MLMRAVGFAVALALVLVIVVGMDFALMADGRRASGLPPAPPETPAPGEVVLVDAPAGSEGPLAGCVVCHNVDPAGAPRAAPDLAGIVGADKASSPWFAYSRALYEADGTWTEADLDRYLTKPTAFLPGTKKTIVGIPDDRLRREIITALKATGTH